MKNYSILLVALLCIIFSCANQTSKEALSKNLYLGDCNNDSICTTIANVDSHRSFGFAIWTRPNSRFVICN